MSARGWITLDIDWAPDFAIDHAAQLLMAAGVRATWFVTHDSPAVRRLRERPELFELGIHPNFLPGSTHGRNESDVLRHCMSLVPDARVVRTHGLVQTSNLLERIIDETPVRVDVSLFLPHARNLEPVTYYWEGGKRLIRVPYAWEDDFEMVRPDGVWDLEPLIREGNGWMIADFHPIHVFLNSTDLSAYRRVRAMGRLADLPEDQVRPHICTGPGAGHAFRSAIDALRGAETGFLGNIADA